MIIMYGYRVQFKREGVLGRQTCPNCGHFAPHTLCRKINQGTLFTLPILSITQSRGAMCEICGNVQPMPAADYKEQVKRFKAQAAQNPPRPAAHE